MQKIRYIDAIFQKVDNAKCYCKGSLLLQDLLRYSLIINELPLAQEVHFKKRKLQNWVVRNNKEIIDFYNKTLNRRNTTYYNRVHGKEEKLNNAFEILVKLNLIQSAGLAPAEKTGAPITTYKYTKGGILLALIIKIMNSKEVMNITRREDKIIECRKGLEKIYLDVYDIIDLAFEVKDDSPVSNIFYLTLFRKCKAKGILENKFNTVQQNPTREYEEFRFDMRNSYERIAFRGYCEECKSSQNVSVRYLDLMPRGVTNDLRVDCPNCNSGKGLFIMPWY